MGQVIPSSRPVIGRDLIEMKQEFGLSTSDALWVFGLSITKWSEITKERVDLPIKDPTLALLARFLDQNPSLSLVPKYPPASEVFDMFNEIVDVPQKRFSILLGAEASAAYRWRKPGARQTPTSQRLLYYMKITLLRMTENARIEMLSKWSNTVEQEASTRGRKDIFRTGRWEDNTRSKPAQDVEAEAQ